MTRPLPYMVVGRSQLCGNTTWLLIRTATREKDYKKIRLVGL